MVYKYGFCPNCGKKIAIYNGLVGGVYSDYIDVPYKKCPHCNKMYATGKKLYSDMNEDEKQKIENLIYEEMFSIAGTYIVIIGAIFGFICMVLHWINIEISRNIVAFVFIIILIFSVIKGYINSKKVLEQIKHISIK